MKKFKLRPGAKALAVVAHPDDETIWMGGTIMLNPSVKWTILCLTRASDADRAPKFARICRIFGAKGAMADLDDEDGLSQVESRMAIERIVASQTRGQSYDYLFTHGENGEYGHKRHKETHRAVRSLLEAGKLRTKQVYFFNYRKARPGVRPSMAPKPDSDALLKLDPAIFNLKKRLQAEIHGYAWDGIDVGLCTRTEAFKTIYAAKKSHNVKFPISNAKKMPNP
jgi:LmbE family N-acetylglucosaminyl deacetylase